LILDAHSHVHDPVDSHVALLDEAGVDRTIVFGTRPHPERATDVASLRRELSVLADTVSGRSTGAASYRLAWDEVDAAIAAFPDRFIGFGKVDLELTPEQIATVVETEFVRRGYRGIGKLTPPPGEADRVEPALAAAADHVGLPVVVHGRHHLRHPPSDRRTPRPRAVRLGRAVRRPLPGARHHRMRH
jgi:predicted TIM-barrel fold metal-dependent hydrolase